MKILKKGNYFKAYCTEDNEAGTIMKVGDSMGSISIKTEKFSGATACMLELHSRLDSHKEGLEDKEFFKVEEKLNPAEMCTEDGGMFQMFHIEGDNDDEGIFIRLCSWSTNGKHEAFNKLIGRKVKITVETIDE